MKSQIKMSNLTSKIQQLAKGLNKFTISDIQQIFSENQENILIVLKDLEEQSIIKKLSQNEYLYTKMKSIPDFEYQKVDSQNLDDSEWLSIEEVVALTGQKRETIRRKCKRQEYECVFIKSGKLKLYKIKKSSIKIKPKVLYNTIAFKKNVPEQKNFVDLKFRTEKEQNIYDNAPDWGKKYVEKYLTIFKLMGKLKGYALSEFIQKLNIEHPELKTSYASVMYARRRYAEMGLEGLLPKYGHAVNNSSVPKNMYDDFKKLYFSSKKISLEKAVKSLENLGYSQDALPTSKCFARLLSKEYSQEYIATMRDRNTAISEIKLNNVLGKKAETKRTLVPLFDTYIDAANAYIKKYSKNKQNTYISRIGYIKNHLTPFFKDYSFEEITQETINKFWQTKQAEGFAPASLNRFTNCLYSIMKEYNIPMSHLQFIKGNTVAITHDERYLKPKEILKIIKNKTQELWIIALGLSVGELSAIEYSDINFKNQTIKINKFLYNNEIQKHRKKYKIRELKLPTVLMKTLNKTNKGRIFKRIRIQDYEILLNTHVKLLLDKNVSINIIYKLLGYQNIRDFEIRFNFLLPQKLDDNFEII